MPLTQVSSRLIEDTLRYVLGASGTDHYTFTGKGLNGAVNDPTLTLSRGHTYIFENRNSSGAHPFYIKTSIANGGTNDAYNTGVTNNGGAGGTEIVFTVPHDAPDLLYYQCSSHINMAGQLKIAGAVTDGSITESKLADDAVTADKLANSINSAIAANTAKTSLEDESVTLAKFEHGTSSNDGKFLRANNGADPSFETIDLTALSASNLTSGTIPDARFPATLPALDGSALTGISGGLQMVDMWFQKQNVAGGNDTEVTLDSYVDRMTVYSNSVFTGIGTGMTKNGSVFSFPSTGHYEIDFHLQFSCQGYDSARYTHADIVYTVDNSNYSVLNRSRGQSIEYPTNLSNRFSINITTAIFDVTNTSTHKVQFRAQHDQPYIIFGSTTEVTTYIIFKKLGDT